jgi:hypothetical protein
LNTILAPAADDVIVLVVMLLIPIVTGPSMFADPDINKDPVSTKVSTLEENTVPVLPDTVNEPVIITAWFSGLTYEAVDANEADVALEEDIACDALVAKLAVPNKLPVNEPVNEAVTEFKTASDPDTTTFFQFGIVIL